MKGIYGYWDNVKGYVAYIGKDSNIGKIHKLYKWWGENYPNELLYLEI